jgi:hypothetical protein
MHHLGEELTGTNVNSAGQSPKSSLEEIENADNFDFESSNVSGRSYSGDSMSSFGMIDLEDSALGPIMDINMSPLVNLDALATDSGKMAVKDEHE